MSFDAHFADLEQLRHGEVWELESKYIAKALVNIILTLSPQRIILGGGVMHQEQLFPLIRRYTKEYLNGYIQTPEVTGGMELRKQVIGEE